MNSKGFSIIELLVSTGIIAIVSAIVFIGYRDTGSRTFIEDQGNMLLTGIEEARSAALSAVEINKNGDRVSQFTIHFEEDSFILFKDTDRHSRRSFDGQVTIGEGSGKGIGFIPPEPYVIFIDEDGNEIDTDKGSIDVVLVPTDQNSESITVRTNRVGLVRIGRDLENGN